MNPTIKIGSLSSMKFLTKEKTSDTVPETHEVNTTDNKNHPNPNISHESINKEAPSTSNIPVTSTQRNLPHPQNQTKNDQIYNNDLDQVQIPHHHPIDPGKVQKNFKKLISSTNLDSNYNSEDGYHFNPGDLEVTYEGRDDSSEDVDYVYESSIPSEDFESFQSEDLSSDDQGNGIDISLIDVDVATTYEDVINSGHLSLRGRGRGRGRGEVTTGVVRAILLEEGTLNKTPSLLRI
ncbi:hypothetical protein K7X08_019583 [Anisodus acutangulus]|uniref:Uncharacterized protein n=1 Tax=Anisodus acutangulus TaxID=402998 RepID=A0A9Q1RPX0_9SOLA|nr:hypothetical protein K7X08_019583 [Anisodus acutangulus]